LAGAITFGRVSACLLLQPPYFFWLVLDASDGIVGGFRCDDYSPVSNIGDIWGLEEGADESSIILDTNEVSFDALLQDFV